MAQRFIHWIQFPTGVMLMLRQFLVHSIQQHLIGDFANVQACLVHDSNKSFVRLLDEVADNLIVEIFYILPGDTFSQVFLLFLL